VIMKGIPDTAPLFKVDAKLQSWMCQIRRHIHAHPELSFQEHKTSHFIQEKLKELNVSFSSGHAGTGVVAFLPGESKEPGCGVALRADMDALPITEETGLSFSSTTPGVMHACGHDGHTAMLLGAASLLSKRKLKRPVTLIFQPAEEHGNGAEKLVNEGILQGAEVIFGGHIDTHLPTGVMTVDPGIVCAWADPFTITLRGRSGHAARPHQAVDALVAAANLIMSAQTLVSRSVDPNRSAVVTFGSVEAGTAQNIIAQDALLKGTVRSTHEQTRSTTLDGLQRMVESIGRMHGVEADLFFENRIPAVINDIECAEIAHKAAMISIGVNAVESQGVASLGAEDFAFYQQMLPGCMVRFGASCGKGAGVSHSGTFTFDENVLTIGALWYANVVQQWFEKASERGGEDER